MSEETYTFEQARARLEEIAKQAKGAGLEQALDLLEEGVQLANVCTEKIDHTRWRDEVDEAQGEEEAATGQDASSDGDPAEDGVDDATATDDEPEAVETDAKDGEEEAGNDS